MRFVPWSHSCLLNPHSFRSRCDQLEARGGRCQWSTLQIDHFKNGSIPTRDTGAFRRQRRLGPRRLIGTRARSHSAFLSLTVKCFHQGSKNRNRHEQDALCERGSAFTSNDLSVVGRGSHFSPLSIATASYLVRVKPLLAPGVARDVRRRVGAHSGVGTDGGRREAR
jgi:hypothetical protein